MAEDANDEESLDGLSFKQQREENSIEEVVPESSYIGAEDSLVWSTDGHQPPNRRLFAKPSSPMHDSNLESSLNKSKDSDTRAQGRVLRAALKYQALRFLDLCHFKRRAHHTHAGSLLMVLLLY